MYVIKLTDNYVEKPEYWMFGTCWTCDKSCATVFATAENARCHIESQGWPNQRAAIGAVSVEPLDGRRTDNEVKRLLALGAV